MLNIITELTETMTNLVAGPNAPARTRRLVQRAIAVGALVGCVTLLGPVFGYGLMAIVGMFIMLLANPEKKERS